MSIFKQFVVVCVTMAIGTELSQQSLQSVRGVQPVGGGGVQPVRGGGVQPVRGGGATFNCPTQERGTYEYTGDCTKFYQCDGGISTLINCSDQLVYNARKGYCDFAIETSNPNCAARENNLPQEVRNLCSVNPGIRDQAFLVGHPEICNAFYTCTLNYLHNGCTFCGEFEYFSLEARGCRSYQTLGQDLSAICQGRKFVEHREKVYEQLRSCWPYNPLLAQLVAGVTTTSTPQRYG